MKNYLKDKDRIKMGKMMVKQYPELSNMDAIDSARFIQEKAYKGLPKLREALGMKNDITINEERLNQLGAHGSSSREGVKLLPIREEDREEQLGVAAHEFGHQLDETSLSYAKQLQKQKEYEDSNLLQKFGKKLTDFIYPTGVDLDAAKKAVEEMKQNYPDGKLDPFFDNVSPTQDKDHHLFRDFEKSNRNKKTLEEIVKSGDFSKLKGIIS